MIFPPAPDPDSDRRLALEAAERARMILSAFVNGDDRLVLELIQHEPDMMRLAAALAAHATSLLRLAAEARAMDAGDYWRLLCERAAMRDG